MKKIVFLVMLIITAAVLIIFYINLEDVNYNVYSSIIKRYKYNKNQSIVILDTAEAEWLTDDYLSKNGWKKYIQSLPNFQKSTYVNFVSECKEKSILTKKFNLSKEYFILKKNIFESFFEKNQNAWKKFYDLYPNAIGVISFSKIGFNEQKNQALLYVEFSSNHLATNSGLIFLTKSCFEWTIEKIMPLMSS